jgi:ABC-type branched-subunit amino acid transport system permease subunit
VSDDLPPERKADQIVARPPEPDARARGLRSRGAQAWLSVPASRRFGLIVVVAALLPVVGTSDYIVRVGVNTLIYALLALGLNVVVGWAGLLDLGYVAFFGFGGYAYALLSSNQFHVHWPAIASVPVVVAAAALLGGLIGLPSRRLLGDYLAILTLFFGQAFVTLVSNADRITPPGFHGAVNFTGGPSGIASVDNIHSFGLTVKSVRGYFYLALVVFVLVAAALYSLNNSRTGRAWRALREDPMAAGLMGMPVNRLKLLAFMFGAGVAGLTGTIFAALQVGVFPGNFEIPLLITLYAMVILGGAGSMTGVITGAVTINVVLEILRTPDPARWVFYGVIVAALLTWVRPFGRLAAIGLGTIAFGLVTRLVATEFAPAATSASTSGSGLLGRLVDHWVILLTNPRVPGNIAYAGLLVAAACLTQMRGWWRSALLVPTLYLAAFVWENVLVTNPSVARLIILGALLIALMNARPQGLFGTSRIEIA